ncbi:RiPP maturation radical SAM C-methyltransferase [Pontivivens ytuae]|uniref:RiPP maturation radical SAM C-methyltransferase n=1 Tax=Pontivivens ytuae TaxID=2789856 RepID=UPI001E36E186|nr:RiPP maturation radical SAM C-methyltransferase [Pontivivens ytuae]
MLKSIAQQSGSTCESYDANLVMANRIGADAYETLAETPAIFGLCEHVFACDLFGPDALDSDAFIAQFGDDGEGKVFRELRDRIVPSALDDMEDAVLAAGHSIIGFSCTFNQVFPSLALARRIKLRTPETTILLGGACVHGEMGEEYARAFVDIVDHVFLGESDESFPAFLRCVDSGSALAQIDGITVRGSRTTQPKPISSMDAVPAPDYSDFYATRRAMIAKGASLPDVAALPYEGSRGCWWGQKHHCTFCGLNNLGMAFREKPASRVAEEIAALAQRHQIMRFMAADNIITHRDLRALLNRLADLEGEFSLFYEVKTNLKRDEVAALAKAGVRWVQPGIEAFSDAQLRRMEKGCTALQNVRLLRLCAEFGIQPSYNILVGFPGETVADYDEQISLMARILHLSPPSGPPSLVQIHRFSPFHARQAEFGFENVRPVSYYAHLVPADVADIGQIAYFFDRDNPPDAPLHEAMERLRNAVDAWRAANRTLTLRLGPGFSEVTVATVGDKRIETLDLFETALLLHADSPKTADALVALSGAVATADGSKAAEILESMVERGFLAVGDRTYVSTVPFAEPQCEAALSRWLDRWGGIKPVSLHGRSQSRAGEAQPA